VETIESNPWGNEDVSPDRRLRMSFSVILIWKMRSSVSEAEPILSPFFVRRARWLHRRYDPEDKLMMGTAGLEPATSRV